MVAVTQSSSVRNLTGRGSCPGLAKVYATIGHSVVGTSEDLDRAKAAADHALRLEPDQPLAHAVLAEILFYRDWDIRAAGTAFLAPLRDDSRFQDLVRRVGWPPRNAPAVAERRGRIPTTT